MTVNEGSNDLTQIDGIFTSSPTTTTISSGGLMPDAAVAYSAGEGGILGLVVANSGDGRLALLQPGSTSLSLAGIGFTSDLPVPTGLAATSWPGGSATLGVSFIAATAGQDAADLLRFDFGIGGTLLTTPSSEVESASLDGQLTAELVALGDSPLELIAIFWVTSQDQGLNVATAREPGLITAFYSPTEGQGENANALTSTSSESQPAATPPGIDDLLNLTDLFQGLRFVTGVEEILNSPLLPIEALAAIDLPVLDRQTNHADRDFALSDSIPIEPVSDANDDSVQGSIDEAIRLPIFPIPAPSAQRSEPTLAPTSSLDPPGQTSPHEGDSQIVAIPLASSVALLSARLIFRNGKPGTRLRFRKPSGQPPSPDQNV